MAINMKNTDDVVSDGIKILAYGQAGSGKTTMLQTLPDPFVISAEGGLLSISGTSIPYVEISNMDDLFEVYEWVRLSEEASKFASVGIDSISEIAEVCLSKGKKESADPRQAYGKMQDEMAEAIRRFRDIKGKNVYMSAKLDKSTDEMGRVMYAPSLPGNKAAQGLPYFFDEVLALRVEKGEDGTPYRALMCDSDGAWAAKDRSGKLDLWEQPDLGAIIRKIGGESD